MNSNTCRDCEHLTLGTTYWCKEREVPLKDGYARRENNCERFKRRGGKR